MQWFKKIKTEYVLIAAMFACVVWSVFAGFRISRYQWIFIFGSAVLFLGMCMLFDHNSKNLLITIGISGIYWLIAHKELINGFRIINNKMAEAINQSMDLGFYYYVSVALENSRRDSVLAVLFFVLATGVVLGLLRYRPLFLFLITGIMEVAILIIAPYGISSAFFLFLGLWIIYFSLKKEKRGFAIAISTIFLISSMALYFHDQIQVPSDTMIKRGILVQIREWTQGKGYLAVGGIGNGKLKSVGEISPTGEKLFQVYAPENEDLYLKGFVSGRYKDGEWVEDEGKDPLIYGGETALELPYLFPDLSMQDFVTYEKGYIKTSKDIAFSEKRDLRIHYQKIQENYVLFPYFCDINNISGNVIADRAIKRNTLNKDYNMSYYHIKNLKKLIEYDQKFDIISAMQKNTGQLEKNYVRSMQKYGSYVRNNYLEVPKHLKNVLDHVKCHVDDKKSISYNIEEIRQFLQKNYQYTYRPGLTMQGKDPIEMFLVDRKKGFCTQYASAAVFLFRKANIPARYVEGYKVRADQWKLGKAQVTDYEAHAWVEIYLDHIGWVPVDVTGRNTGKATYTQVEKEEKQRNAIVPNKKQFITNVKKVLQIVPIILTIGFILLVTKLLQKKRKWNKMSNRQKVLYYEKQIDKYAENDVKSTDRDNHMVNDILEKARYSYIDITKDELMLVKRRVDLLKRKNRNITKMLTRLKQS